MNKLPPLAGIALGALLWGTLPATAQTHSSVLGSGGAIVLQGEHRLCFTVGQSAIGGVADASVVAGQGFWHARALAKVSSGPEDSAFPTVEPTLAAFPNPGSGLTTIEFSLPDPGRVALDLYDALGQRVRSLVDGSYDAGTATASVDLGDLSSGHYTVVLRSGDRRAVVALVLVD